jgi:hypothetical protein
LSRRPCPFRETDLKRALKGALAAGMEIARIEIDKDGRIIVVPGEPTKGNGSGYIEQATETPLEQWRKHGQGQP